MYNYKPSKRDFYLWLNSSSLIGGQKIYRKDWISWFHGAITRWMSSLGYKMNESWKQTPILLARWLYCIQVIEIARQDYMGKMYYDDPNHRDTFEDRERYDFIVNYMEIEKFLDNFETNEELCERGKSGMRVRVEFADFLYIHLDIENSKQGHYVNRIIDANLSDNEDDEMGGRNIDSYVVDSAEGWH